MIQDPTPHLAQARSVMKRMPYKRITPREQAIFVKGIAKRRAFQTQTNGINSNPIHGAGRSVSVEMRLSISLGVWIRHFTRLVPNTIP